MSKYRIAVIKKHDIERRLASMVLPRYGMDFELFDCPESFLDYQGEMPDCIVCGVWFDQKMTAMGFLGVLRERGLSIPVVIASNMTDYQDQVMQAGAVSFTDGFLSDGAAIVSAIIEAIESRQVVA